MNAVIPDRALSLVDDSGNHSLDREDEVNETLNECVEFEGKDTVYTTRNVPLVPTAMFWPTSFDADQFELSEIFEEACRVLLAVQDIVRKRKLTELIPSEKSRVYEIISNAWYIQKLSGDPNATLMCKISLTPSGKELEQIKAHHCDIRNVFKSCEKMGLSTGSIVNVCSKLLEKLRIEDDEYFVEQSEQIEDTTDLAQSTMQPTLNVARKVFCPHVNTFFPDRKGKESTLSSTV